MTGLRPPLGETRSRLARNWDDLDEVLTSGIYYFLEKRGTRRLAPVSELTLQGKVELFADLLPDSPNTDYVLRFSTNLARVLWLELEQRRILAQRENARWLYPLYQLADCVATVGIELEEALRFEHKDFDKARFGSAEDDDALPEDD